MGAGLVYAGAGVGPAVVERGRRRGAVTGVEVGVARDIGDGRRNVGRPNRNGDGIDFGLVVAEADALGQDRDGVALTRAPLAGQVGAQSVGVGD